MDGAQPATSGMRMSAVEAAAAEAALIADLEDVQTRVKLVGFYRLSPERARHVHWLIDHRPALSLGVRESAPVALGGWVRRGEGAVTGADREARELILRGLAIAPSPDWHLDLAWLHWYAWAEASSAPERREHSAQVVAQCDEALALETSPTKRYDWQVELARAATEAGFVH